MKRMHIRLHFGRKWIISTLLISVLSLIFLLSATLRHSTASPWSDASFLHSTTTVSSGDFGAGDDMLGHLQLPRFSYLIYGTTGDGRRLLRLLQAVYHPRNYYLLHPDLDASEAERLELAMYVQFDRVMSKSGNVMVVGKVDLITYKGPTTVAFTLHAIAILLKQVKNWDWFINLSASDYPLMSQDGSAWVVLTRPFLELCARGWDNLPRTLLLYHANILLSANSYFHTVACNHKDFQNTTVNHGLRYIKWDSPPRELPVTLTANDFDAMVQSGALFGHAIGRDDPVLDKIDRVLLRRGDMWFGIGPCVICGDPDFVSPTLGSRRLEQLLVTLLF